MGAEGAERILFLFVRFEVAQAKKLLVAELDGYRQVR